MNTALSITNDQLLITLEFVLIRGKHYIIEHGIEDSQHQTK